MKSGAPGGFECETYITAWAQGLHTQSALRHIDDCQYCRAIIHGEGDHLKTSQEQDEGLAQHFAEAKQITEQGFTPPAQPPWPNQPTPEALSCFEELKLRFAQELEEDDDAEDAAPKSIDVLDVVKPHLLSIQIALQTETDPTWQAVLTDLVVHVTNP
ncbi:MAG: hypothetical protein V3W41_15785 [Planctomycetota bacterium]